MTGTKDFKRENFDVGPQQQAEIEALQDIFETASKKEAVLMAVKLALHLAAETKDGNQLFMGRPGEALHRLILLGLEKPPLSRWSYLVEHAHPWKRQLFVKGRKLPAAVVWSEMKVNNLSITEATNNWDLPVEAIHEILRYCEANKSLIEMEAAEENRLLMEKGIKLK